MDFTIYDQKHYNWTLRSWTRKNNMNRWYIYGDGWTIEIWTFPTAYYYWISTKIGNGNYEHFHFVSNHEWFFLSRLRRKLNKAIKFCEWKTGYPKDKKYRDNLVGIVCNEYNKKVEQNKKAEQNE